MLTGCHHSLLITGLLCLVPGSLRTACSQDASPVVVSRVIEAEVNTGQRVVGTVKPLRTSTIGSAVDGRVEELLVNQGNAVEQGQVLARLRTATLEIQRSAAKAEVELAQQSLIELQNGSRPEDIAEAEANMRGAEAAFSHADSNLKRIQQLATTRAASASDLTVAKQQADAARFAYQATQALYDRIKQGPRTEMIAQAAAQVELQQQRLNLIEDQISKFTIVAPFDGFVSAEFTEMGAWLSRGDPILEVVQLSEVEIQADVTAESVVNLRVGNVVRVEFPELPNELLTGTVDRIVPVAAARTRTFPVMVRAKNRIENGLPMFLAGMLVRVDLPSGTKKTQPLVPKDALVLNGKDRAVFVVDVSAQDGSANGERIGIARKVPVDIGIAVEDRIQVRGDLKHDDLVVVVGNERLIPGAEVRIVREADSTDL